MELIYQTIGYKNDNQDPTQEDIETATRNALSVPAAPRFHLRIWFPERQGLVKKYWQWLRDETHYTMSLPLMQNCGHVALFGYMPATEKVTKENEGTVDTVWPRENFMKDGKVTWFGDWHTHNQVEIIRDFYLITGSMVYEYARTMKQLGYFSGFGSCIHGYAQSFNDTFKEAFNGEPFIPVCMVHAGTKAAIITHKTTRQGIKDVDLSVPLVEVESTPTAKKILFEKKKKNIKNVPFYTTADDGTLISITKEQAMEMGAFGTHFKKG